MRGCVDRMQLGPLVSGPGPLLVACLLGLGACAGASAPDGHAQLADTRVAAPTCAETRGDKLGVPFVRVCRPLSPDAWWVAATPLPCSDGAHELLECPTATSLMVEPATGPALSPRSALVTDAVSAYRTCAMRFGGRLPTAGERRHLATTQGLAAFVATAAADGTTQLAPLDEWTADGDCGNPSKPGADCRFARFPGARAATRDWGAMLRCEASVAPTEASLADAVGLDGSCRAGAPCLVRSPWFLSVDAPLRLHAIQCTPLAATPPHPAPRADVAAFRCVLPEAAVTAAP